MYIYGLNELNEICSHPKSNPIGRVFVPMGLDMGWSRISGPGEGVKSNLEAPIGIRS